MSRLHTTLLLACLLAACASTTGNTYYSLSRGGITADLSTADQDVKPSDAKPSSAESAAPQDRDTRPVISLAPIRLPVAVDRSQIVLREQDRVRILETSRWAQPLKYELGSALAADLAQALPDYQVYESARAMRLKPQIDIGLEVLQFDSVRGVAATIEVRWRIRDLRAQYAQHHKHSQPPVLIGHAQFSEPVTGDSLDALADAHARALARISRQIAQQVSQQIEQPLPQ